MQDRLGFQELRALQSLVEKQMNDFDRMYAGMGSTFRGSPTERWLSHISGILDQMMDHPGRDAEMVLRCRNCRKYNQDDCPMAQEFYGRDPQTAPDGYCYLGVFK